MGAILRSLTWIRKDFIVIVHLYENLLVSETNKEGSNLLHILSIYLPISLHLSLTEKEKNPNCKSKTLENNSA